jgi:protein-S-isoprenylcysteine O-methyltransferase Ste14
MESSFRVQFILCFVAVITYRLYQHWKAETYRGSNLFHAEGKILGLLRMLLLLPLLGAILTYIFYPQGLSWASLPVPVELRWLGTGLQVLAFGLLVWVHRALDRNFCTTLRIRPDHTLVTSGPYRWVRHPMYTVFVLAFVGICLQTANWFLGGFGLLALALVMIFRTPMEEAQLLARFGDEYRHYMERTGRFLPRLFQPSR